MTPPESLNENVGRLKESKKKKKKVTNLFLSSHNLMTSYESVLEAESFESSSPIVTLTFLEHCLSDQPSTWSVFRGLPW